MTWSDDLRALAPLAARAPSPHNAQPWTVDHGADALTIGWDPARSLPAGDPTRRDLYLCLGGYLETWLIAAADAGLDLRAEVRVDPATRTVARLVPADSPHVTDFTADDIAARGCARGPHRAGRLDPEEIARARLQLTATGLTELRAQELADLAVRADRRLWSAPGVAAELRSWLRLTPGHPRYHQDGLTYEALAMSRAEAAGLRAVLAAHASRPLAPLLASSQSGLLRGEGSVLVLSGSPDAAEDMVRAGRELLRVWYALAAQGISVHPLSQLVDCAETERELRRRVGARPLAVFRAGYPVSAPPRSARLPSPPASRP